MNNMKKALLVSTVSGFVPQFEMNSVRLLQEHGYEVHYATNYDYPFYGKDNSRLDGTGIERHQIDFARSPYSIQTFRAYKQLSELMSRIKFDVVHCHTPIGSILARMVAKKNGVPVVIYTAHGFHFYKGASFLNWALYYTAERLMARNTDALITINHEDYENAKRFRLKPNGKVFLVSGVGIDTNRFAKVNSQQLQPEWQKETGKLMMLSVGELNDNKNHEVVIRAIAATERNDFRYYICGEGSNREKLTAIIHELGLEDSVKLLGYRTDIPLLCHQADVFVMPSLREGLPVSMMEAMSAGLPVLASRVRGNVDLVEDHKNGLLSAPTNIEEWKSKLIWALDHPEQLKQYGANNSAKMKLYDVQSVKSQMAAIYEKFVF